MESRTLPTIWIREDDYPLLGRVVLAATEEGLCLVSLADRESADRYLQRVYPGSEMQEDAERLLDAARQLREFVEGRRTRFDLRLAPAGTPFQNSVWEALAAIPYGETRTYGEIAARIGRPTAVRAVGAANGANPLCVVLPCHRVLGASGKLTGYAYGLNLKERLLALEARVGAQEMLSGAQTGGNNAL